MSLEFVSLATVDSDLSLVRNANRVYNIRDVSYTQQRQEKIIPHECNILLICTEYICLAREGVKLFNHDLSNNDGVYWNKKQQFSVSLTNGGGGGGGGRWEPFVIFKCHTAIHIPFIRLVRVGYITQINYFHCKRFDSSHWDLVLVMNKGWNL